MANNHATLNALIEPVVSAMGFELWGIDHLAQGKHSRLVVYIDSDKGVTVDDCADISRQIGAVLDVEDPISGEYRLEVSSPGMDRPLFDIDHFARFKGHQAMIRLRTPFEGRRKFQGFLVGVEGEDVLLQLDGEEYCFPMDAIDRARIVPTFEK